MTGERSGAPAGAPRTRTWRDGVVGDADFRHLWGGQTVTQVGTQLSELAVPVLAVQVLGAGAFQMGLLTASSGAAFLLLGLPAGAWVDRSRKRRLMVVTDLVRAAALLTIPLAYLLDVLTFAQLLVVTAVVGTGSVFFDVSYQSVLPSLVPPEHLVDANSKLEASTSVAEVAGPALGGQLLRVLSAPFVILLDALTFLVSAFLLRRITAEDPAPDRADRRPLRTEVAEGFSFVVRHPLLRRIAATASLFNLAFTAVMALLVLYALRDLGLSEAQLGLALSLGALGGLLGAVVATRFARRVGEGRAIPLAALAIAPPTALLPLAGDRLPAAPAIAVGMFGVTLAVVVLNVTQVSFRQRLCPPQLLGRMNASVRFLVWGTVPVGALLGGAAASAWGIRPTLWAAVAGVLVAALPVLLSPLRGMRDLPTDGR